MPKVKKRVPKSESDSDSGPDDRGPLLKKTKKENASYSVDADGSRMWHLENKRFVKVRDFKGKVYVDIREYYEADGELKPGKKRLVSIGNVVFKFSEFTGISLSAKQWHTLKGFISEIDEALKET